MNRRTRTAEPRQEVNVEAVRGSKAARPPRAIVPYAASIDRRCPEEGLGDAFAFLGQTRGWR
jgi:hypothetical protein